MAKTNDNVVPVEVTRSRKHPQFYFVQGPGGVILSVSPMHDPVTGEKHMTERERYTEIENILQGNRHQTNPEDYEVVNTYQAPANFQMLSDLDMRHKTLDQMTKVITDSTKT